MALRIINIVSQVFSYPLEMFTDLLYSTGMTQFFLMMFLLFMAVTYLIRNFVVSAGKSDTAKRRKVKEDI